jgi:thiamine-monophosphate kinase
MVRRTTAAPCDALYVSGTIGDAALGLALRKAEVEGRAPPEWAKTLDAAQCSFLRDRYWRPRPRLALAPVLLACASAAMDVSDGLVGDLRAMMAANGVTARADLRLLPLSPAAKAALAAKPDLFETLACGGDDYEILCAVPSASVAQFEVLAQQAGVPVTRVGLVTSADAAEELLGPEGESLAFARDRFSHF